MLRIGKLSSQRTKVISISEAGRRQSRQHAPELESVYFGAPTCNPPGIFGIIHDNQIGLGMYNRVIIVDLAILVVLRNAERVRVH